MKKTQTFGVETKDIARIFVQYQNVKRQRHLASLVGVGIWGILRFSFDTNQTYIAPLYNSLNS